MPKSFYITTTLPYVNSDPHVGFAMEIIRADVIARYKKLQGIEVFFNTGTDEHGQKVWQKSQEGGVEVQKYVDGYAQKFKDLIPLLNISPDIHFTRTTDKNHVKSAQDFWNVCKENIGPDGSDIYKKEYKIKYCVGCELEKQESELDENGKCLIHSHMEIEIREEENYFFRFSRYEKPLLKFYEKNPEFVIPDFRFNEIKKFVERGLEDFSISRLKSKMPWGVSVPDDSEHVMYVWFDALVNYISVLGWPSPVVGEGGGEVFNKFWKNGETLQYAGKDNLRQQSAMWQAMLMSAGIKNTDHIVINGFINSGGQKMSKSLGNSIFPSDVVNEYGTDALRYYCLRELSNFEDSDMTVEKFKEAYNANLANGLGNLTSRIMKMASDNLDEPVKIEDLSNLDKEFYDYLEKFEINKAVDYVWAVISFSDREIQTGQPFKVVKEDKKRGREMITKSVNDLNRIAGMLMVILPETSEKIKNLIKENKTPEKPLFLRKD